MDIRETLRDLLENSELQQALIEAFATGTDSPEAFQSIELVDHSCSRIVQGGYRCFLPASVSPILELSRNKSICSGNVC